jgi:anti-anti-sigma regulatory factor
MKTGSNSTARARSDGRKSLLVYLHPEVIKDLKKAALDEEKTAYEITEEAVSVWLANRKNILKEKGE